MLAASAVLLTAGTLLPLAFEAGNAATYGGMPAPLAFLNALFQSVTYRTAGMSTVPVGQLTDATLLTGIALMFIGGASGSTAGGIKVTTLAVLVAAVFAVVRGRPYAGAFGRRVPEVVVLRALAVAMLSAIAVFVVIVALELTTTRRPVPRPRVRGGLGVRHRRPFRGRDARAPGRRPSRPGRRHVRRAARAAYPRPCPVRPGTTGRLPAGRRVRCGSASRALSLKGDA